MLGQPVVEDLQGGSLVDEVFLLARGHADGAELLGSSTEAILRELLEADDEEIARLRAAGALGPEDP